MVNAFNPDQEIGAERTIIATDNPQVAEELTDMSMDDFSNRAYEKNKIPQKLKKFIDMDNIADELDDRKLEEIATIVIDGFDIDKKSCQNWDECREEIYKLLKFEVSTKNTPWENAANIKLPLLMSGAIQFNADLLQNIIKDDKVVKVASLLKDNNAHTIDDRGERMSAHMSYQNIVQSDHWVKDTDKASFLLYFIGLIFRKSFFNAIEGCYDTEFCLPEHIAINSYEKSIESAQRITHILYMTSNELIENMRMGLFIDHPMDELIPESGEREMPKSFSVSEEENRNLYDYVHEVYEQHRFLDLDGDGYQEPYIVTVHKESQKILRIVARYDESSFEYNDSGKFVKINPIHYFTDYHFMPNPDGSFHSIGFGTLLLHLNESVNTILNQLIDAGTLANQQSGFLGRDLRLPKGDLDFKPGEWKQVTTSAGSTIQQNIVPLPVKEPSQTLFALLGFLVDFSKTFTNITGIGGEMPAPNIPATTVMAVVEQGQRVYNSILYRIYDSLKREFQKQFDINKKYLKEQEQFPMAQSMGMVTIQDYRAPNFGIYPVADPNLSTSMQRMFQAQALMQLMNTPQINNYEILKNYLQVLKIQDPEQYLVKPDPNAPPPPEVRALDAQIRNVEMDTACKLLDRELTAWGTGIDEMKVKSQSAYYGGQLAGDKVDSIVKLTELETKVPPAEVEKAAIEEEALTRQTQFQDVAPEFHDRLQALENIVARTMMGIQTGGMQQPTAPEQPPTPMEGMPEQPPVPAEEVPAEME